ncbi:PREDICTED: chordin-like, partial [Cariama cristata]|uniref:chordin-like n=1 Tax=Cariama cristata TaxID=54380 RepID=UPI00052079E8
SPWVPLRVRILHQSQTLREVHANITVEVQVVGTASEVVGITLETKPRRKSKRNVLFDMTPSFKDGL